MISIHIPKGAQALDIRSEIASAKRIRDRQTRVSTITGLNKIAHYL